MTRRQKLCRPFLFRNSYVVSLGFGSVLNTGDKAYCGKQRNDGRTAVAEEGQRDTYNRGDAHAHSDVYEGLECECSGNTVANEHTEGASASCSDDAAADDYEHKQSDYDETGDHAHLLTDGSKDTVGVP